MAGDHLGEKASLIQSQSKLTSGRGCRILLFLLGLQACLSAQALSWDRPFDNPANWGGTGLMEIPTARVLDDGVLRIGAAQALPYRWITVAMGIFPGLEFSGRFTELTNIETGMKGYGSYKDKAFDIKYQLLPESRRFPAVAVGLHDFHGTKLFPAEYLVLNRQVFPFDFTIGLGRKRLGGGPSLPFLRSLGLFGGVELALNPRLQLMVEYNPIEYEKDRRAAGRAVPEGASWPVNIGMRLKLLPGVELGISYQRGDTLGFMGHLQFLLGKPILPQRPDPPLPPPVRRRPPMGEGLREVVDKVHSAMHGAGFKDVSVYASGTELTVEFENSRYLYEQKAVGRVLRIMLFYSPANIRKLTAIVKRRHMAILSISVSPSHFRKYILGKVPEEIFSRLLDVRSASGERMEDREELIASKADQGIAYRVGIKPDFETYLNDPSGVFKCRPGMKPWAIASPWKGAAVFARYDIPFYSDIRSSNPVEPNAVRSDSWLYSDRDYSFDRLLMDQAFRLPHRTFARISVGYLERMYAGTQGEVLTFLWDGNLAMGVEADWARKREPGAQFALKDFEAHSILGSLYWKIPDIGVTLHARYGRFLAGDRGWLFEVSRQYDTGVTFGFWYSFTDTDGLSGYNKGYHDKGVFLSLPARMFLARDSRERYYYALSPWTRDVAATVFRWQPLYDLASGLMPAEFRKGFHTLRD